MRNSLLILFALALAGLAVPSTASAQFLEELGDAAKDAAEHETRRQARRAARNAVRCAVGEFECIRKAKREDREVVVIDENGDPVSDERADETIAAAEGGAAARGLWAELSAEGQATIRGLGFEEGSATIVPASAPAIAEIAAMLNAHPDLELLVQGHVDGTGGFDAEMELSKARAEAVKATLVQDHGIAADRLRAMGLGSTQKVTAAETPEAREENSRIVLVRI